MVFDIGANNVEKPVHYCLSALSLKCPPIKLKSDLHTSRVIYEIMLYSFEYLKGQLQYYLYIEIIFWLVVTVYQVCRIRNIKQPRVGFS